MVPANEPKEVMLRAVPVAKPRTTPPLTARPKHTLQHLTKARTVAQLHSSMPAISSHRPVPVARVAKNVRQPKHLLRTVGAVATAALVAILALIRMQLPQTMLRRRARKKIPSALKLVSRLYLVAIRIKGRQSPVAAAVLLRTIPVSVRLLMLARHPI